MYQPQEFPYPYHAPPRPAVSVNPINLVGLALVLLFGFSMLRGRSATTGVTTTAGAAQPVAGQGGGQTGGDRPAPAAAPASPVIAPYEEYLLTQGPHGFEYGHMAIDLSAGQGSVVRSPIDGVVTRRFVDGVGNTVLVIANERYEVTLLHGLYSVAAGDKVQQGEPVGTESNQGYTLDMNGRSCRGRDCGYHTHLNIFDRQLGANVNPLDIIDRPAR